MQLIVRSASSVTRLRECCVRAPWPFLQLKAFPQHLCTLSPKLPWDSYFTASLEVFSLCCSPAVVFLPFPICCYSYVVVPASADIGSACHSKTIIPSLPPFPLFWFLSYFRDPNNTGALSLAAIQNLASIIKMSFSILSRSQQWALKGVLVNNILLLW